MQLVFIIEVYRKKNIIAQRMVDGKKKLKLSNTTECPWNNIIG